MRVQRRSKPVNTLIIQQVRADPKVSSTDGLIIRRSKLRDFANLRPPVDRFRRLLFDGKYEFLAALGLLKHRREGRVQQILPRIAVALHYSCNQVLVVQNKKAV